MNYKEILKELREEKNLTQLQVANALKISRNLYNQYEHQYHIIPVLLLNEVANYFDVSIDYLLGLNKNRQYKNSNKLINKELTKERLKETRKHQKLTQEEFSKKINTTQPVIANYERGRNIISTSFLYDMCKKFDVSADYILGKIDAY